MRSRGMGRDAGWQQLVERRHRDERREVFLRSLPQKYVGYTLDDLNDGWQGRLPRGAKNKLTKLVTQGDGGFVLLLGDAGQGKSTLAATLATELVWRRGSSGMMRSTSLLLNDFSYRPDGIDPIRDAGTVDVLIIDDYGAANEGVTPHQERSFWALIEMRWSNPSAVTFITSNMALETSREGIGIKDKLGPSTWDRVQDKLLLVEMQGASFRGDAAMA